MVSFLILLAIVCATVVHLALLRPAAHTADLPTLCVVVPYHSRTDAALLPRAILSLQSQTYPQWTAVLVDDSAGTLPAPAFRDPRLILDQLAWITPGGEASASNAGVARCLQTNADFIGVLHADDRYADNLALATVAGAIATSGGNRTVMFGYQEERPDGTIKYVSPCVGQKADVHCRIPPFLKWVPRAAAAKMAWCALDTLFEDTCLHYAVTAERARTLVRVDTPIVTRTIHSGTSLHRVNPTAKFLFFVQVYESILAAPYMAAASDDVLYSIVPRLRGALPPNHRDLRCVFERVQEAVRSRMRDPKRLPAPKPCPVKEACVVTPTHDDFEGRIHDPSVVHIVVDDHSREPPPDSIPSHFRGAGRARNVGMAACNAPYMAFVDADDTLDSGCLKKVLNAMRTTGADLAITEYQNDPGHGMFHADAKAISSNGSAWDRAFGLIAYPWNKVVRSDLAHKTIFGPTMVHNDLAFHWSAIGNARKIAFVRCPLITHKRSDGSRLTFRSKGRERLRDAWTLSFQLLGQARVRPQPDALRAYWKETWRFAYEKGNETEVAPARAASERELAAYMRVTRH